MGITSNQALILIDPLFVKEKIMILILKNHPVLISCTIVFGVYFTIGGNL
jgi:hypothetical protein